MPDKLFIEGSLELDDFVPIGWQLSDALAFLSGKKIIHRDVAARNVLVTKRKMVKLSDFGLCCYAKAEEEYESKEGKLPLKWMAPESIEFGRFSEKSDVWSFGVVLWEMYSFGKSPFESFSHQEILSFLKNGSRLEIPESSPDWIKKIIEECWSEELMKRPEFSGIKREFYRQMEANSTRYGYLHFSKNYYHEEETTKDEDNVI
ncbi:unnamed protein product, partial [Mesorhabditis belari]|uniref:receptor protein-tyrosine kinase n=1 Tax=Mesorhabditis belari TaxID=2138241 RepID=A0AAF3ELS7_9BILA